MGTLKKTPNLSFRYLDARGYLGTPARIRRHILYTRSRSPSRGHSAARSPQRLPPATHKSSVIMNNFRFYCSTHNGPHLQRKKYNRWEIMYFGRGGGGARSLCQLHWPTHLLLLLLMCSHRRLLLNQLCDFCLAQFQHFRFRFFFTYCVHFRFPLNRSM